MNQLIKEDYGYNFISDRLPAAEIKLDERSGERFYDVGGVNMGDDETNPEIPRLNNHFDVSIGSVRLTSRAGAIESCDIDSRYYRQISLLDLKDLHAIPLPRRQELPRCRCSRLSQLVRTFLLCPSVHLV